MIDINKLTDKDKLRTVVYCPKHNLEYGKITSWNSTYIFVKFHTEITKSGTITKHGETSQACKPEDLEFLKE